MSVVPIIMPSTRIIPSPAVQFIIFEVPMNDTRTATFAASYRLDGAPVDQWKLNEMSGRHNPTLFDEATHRYIGSWENRFGQDRARMAMIGAASGAWSWKIWRWRCRRARSPIAARSIWCRPTRPWSAAGDNSSNSARRVADGGDPIGVEVDVSTIRAIDATVPGNVRWQDLVTA